MTILWRGTVLLGIVLGSSLWASEVDVTESDPAFEKRLTTSHVYRSREKESLREIAHFLYGHRTWWKRLIQMNPHLEGVRPDQALIAGTPLTYDAPDVGDIYIVQPNDWLIRIVQWKYGGTEYWEAIYRKNANKISNPNLIHPGDRLILELNGTVRQAASGEVLVEGIESKKEEGVTPSEAPLQNQANLQANLPGNSGGAMSPSTESTTLATETTALGQELHFLFGFLVGLLLLLLGPLLWWIYRRRPVRVESHPSESRAKVPPQAPKKRSRKEAEAQPNVFGRRPQEELTWDRSLVHRDEGEVSRRPNYHTIAKPKKKKNY